MSDSVIQLRYALSVTLALHHMCCDSVASVESRYI